MKLLGREPVYILAFVAIVLKTGAAGAAIVNLAQAALALFLGFGLDMTAQEQAGWMAVVAGAVALWEHREVTAPVSTLPMEQKSPLAPSAPQSI